MTIMNPTHIKPARYSLYIFIILLLSLSGAGYGSAGDKAPVHAVDAVGMTVSDMDRSAAFYADVLGFEKISDVEVLGDDYEHLHGIFGLRMRVVRMRLGEESIELTEFLTPQGRPFPADTRSNDRWFQHIAIVVSDMDKAFERLRNNKVRYASTAPQTIPAWNKAAAGIRAFYFRDPDGHFLEIIYFPAGKGNPKWQRNRNDDKLFLGIDHTAIVVNDTEESLKFYKGALGMNVAGESMNYGTEQEHLNNVFGAVLRITSLRAGEGPGIEFLEYLAPGDGRPAPADERSNDIQHWQTTLDTDDPNGLADKLRDDGYAIISADTVDLPGGELGFKKGFLVRDPDGHVMQVIEK
ncbi:MAG TPA: VOC family protein [Thermodesulfobacteriota bacterium]|nr:VOC family protein [Thermodesulfobacteriota bacterium]